MTGLTSLPALYVPSVPSNSLLVDGHEDDLHETDRAYIRDLIKEAWSLGFGLIENGNFDHFQRDTGVVTSTTTYNAITSYAADRFFVLPAGASVTQQRSTTVPAGSRSQYSLQVNGAASVTAVDIGQRIFSAIVNTRARQSLVFTAQVRNESGAAFTPNLRIGTPGAVDNFATVTNRLDQALQSCADSAWTQVSHVFDPSAYTNIANGMEVCLRVPSGSLVSGDVVRVAQVDLRPGAAVSPFLPPDPDLMLMLARLYYERMGGNSAFEFVGAGKCYATTNAQISFPYAPKWKAPTVTVPTAGNWAVQDATTTLLTATAISGSGTPSRCGLDVTVASGLVAGNATTLLANNTTSARIHLTTE